MCSPTSRRICGSRAVAERGGGAQGHSPATEPRRPTGGQRPPRRRWRHDLWRRRAAGCSTTATRRCRSGRGPRCPPLKRWTEVVIDEPPLRAGPRRYPGLRHRPADRRAGRRRYRPARSRSRAPDHAAGELRLGATLMRVGRWPKRLLLYRTDQPFPKMSVGRRRDPRRRPAVRRLRHPSRHRPALRLAARRHAARRAVRRAAARRRRGLRRAAGRGVRADTGGDRTAVASRPPSAPAGGAGRSATPRAASSTAAMAGCRASPSTPCTTPSTGARPLDAGDHRRARSGSGSSTPPSSADRARTARRATAPPTPRARSPTSCGCIATGGCRPAIRPAVEADYRGADPFGRRGAGPS